MPWAWNRVLDVSGWNGGRNFHGHSWHPFQGRICDRCQEGTFPKGKDPLPTISFQRRTVKLWGSKALKTPKQLLSLLHHLISSSLRELFYTVVSRNPPFISDDFRYATIKFEAGKKDLCYPQHFVREKCFWQYLFSCRDFIIVSSGGKKKQKVQPQLTPFPPQVPRIMRSNLMLKFCGKFLKTFPPKSWCMKVVWVVV